MQSSRLVGASMAVVGVALLLTSCSGSTAGAPASDAVASGSKGVVRVVAGENVWGDIASQIGGSHVTVTSIIGDPSADPHEYESDANDAAALAGARLVIENGLGYDDFMAKLLAASPKDDRAVVSVQQVLHITGSSPNPHIWYDTARVPAVAHAIAQQLAKADPGDAADFARNERTFDASLQPVTDTVAAIRAKYAGTRIAYTERVPGYLTDAAGLTLGMPAGFAEAVEQGDDPSPADDAAFEQAIRSRSVKLLLVNAQVTDQETTDITRLAAVAGVPVVDVTETIPSSDTTYQAWQLRQAREILAALGG